VRYSSNTVRHLFGSVQRAVDLHGPPAGAAQSARTSELSTVRNWASLTCTCIGTRQVAARRSARPMSPKSPEKSGPGADVAGVSPVPVQMWRPNRAHTCPACESAQGGRVE
jgi:hypothetical protein